MKNILNKLFDHCELSYDEARSVLINIAENQYNECETASFLTVYLMRSIGLNELAGFRDAMLDLCIKVDFEDFETIDLCGTGGDGKNTFNISTLASFVVAGAGYKVAKHGNYGVSSGCGSSNVMEYLGYKFSGNHDVLKKQIEKAGICILHAPIFHPAMKNIAPVRKKLGVKTFFNMLGPLVNPSRPSRQLVGVFSQELARKYNYLLQKEEIIFSILYSLDGYDEISLTSPFLNITEKGIQVLTPEELKVKRIKPEQIGGGSSIEDAGRVFTEVLENKGTQAQNQVVCMNAAMAINCFERTKSFEECVSIAEESLASGNAMRSFKKLIELSN